MSEKVDDRYRELCHAEFLKQLEHDIQDQAGLIDPEFIASVVKGIQQTLSQVGVPNAQVSILRLEDSGAYVSYYAGYDQPVIAQGAVISDFSAIGSRRVVYRLPCPLGIEPDTHQLAIAATCPKLDDSDHEFVADASSFLSAACTRSNSESALLDTSSRGFAA
ncbi:MAG TPA: hypothetical protein VFY36_03610 [Solirubrobacteraceae bacterium]|nr:hypothetical protein [Solirubrobacteraceae bacterium]